MHDDRIDELLHRIDDLERRLEDRDRGHHDSRRDHRDHRDGHCDSHHEHRGHRDDRHRSSRHSPDRWPGPPPPPRRGRSGEGDEKRIVDLVVALVTERVEQIITREIDRAVHELRPGNTEDP